MESSSTDIKNTVPKREDITVDYIKSLNKPSDHILCLLRDNKVLRFCSYRIRDIQSGTILMEISEEH
jgi:hypothetical protein